ncbi:MAG: exodeoxyribonuclease III [Desertifilum sp.]|nr:exodeoxyribonuclease III [Desertifilum sp.]
MKIATWNVNSVRTRLEHVTNWLLTNPVDVLCLQETKVIDSDFPRSPFTELGYHPAVCGQKSYNGVAILSRLPLEEVTVGFTPQLGEATVGEFDVQKRLISATVAGVRVISVYIPNGADYGSEKYLYKLHWLKLLREYLQLTLKDYPDLCICGDYNIAPDDRDIHFTTEPNRPVTGTTEVERQAFKDLLALGLGDAFRKFNAEAEQYSWWDYRAAAFRRNLGWRIDHHLLSHPLYEKAIACTIDVTPRQWTKPSDHTPVVVEF